MVHDKATPQHDALSAEWIGYLYTSQYGDKSSFASMLYDLIAKADLRNRERIRKGFPEAVAVWEAWYSHRSSTGFFEEHGLLERRDQ